MTKKKINQVAHDLLDIKEQIAQLEAEAEALTDILKGVMVEQGVETLNGDNWKVSWKNVNSSRFDSTRFRKENPEVAAQYMKQTTSTRFLIG